MIQPTRRRLPAALATLLVATGCAGHGTAADEDSAEAADTSVGQPSSSQPPSSQPPSGVPSAAAKDRPSETLSTLDGWTLPAWRSGTPLEPSKVPGVTGPSGSSGSDTDLEALARAQKVAAEAGLPPSDQLAAEAVDPVGWMALAVDIGRLRALNPVRMARLAAIVSTSMQAAVGANQQSSSGEEPRLADASLDRTEEAKVRGPAESVSENGPADSVAAAAAAAAALTVMFPTEVERIDRALEHAVNVATLSGKWRFESIRTAQSTGAAIGEGVAKGSADDGSATIAEYEPTAGATWVPTPPVFGRAVEPGAGGWVRWNRCSADEAVDGSASEVLASVDTTAAAKQLVERQLVLTDGDRRLAAEWELGPGTSTPTGVWMKTLSDQLQDRNIRVEDQAAALAVLGTVLADTAMEVWRIKYSVGTERPVTVIQREISPTWLPILVTPAFPSFPSGHSTTSAAAAVVLSTFFPDQSDRFVQSAAESGDSRVKGGIHYWYDNRFGLELGTSIARRCLAEWAGPNAAKVERSAPTAEVILGEAELVTAP